VLLEKVFKCSSKLTFGPNPKNFIDWQFRDKEDALRGRKYTISVDMIRWAAVVFLGSDQPSITSSFKTFWLFLPLDSICLNTSFVDKEAIPEPKTILPANNNTVVIDGEESGDMAALLKSLGGGGSRTWAGYDFGIQSFSKNNSVVSDNNSSSRTITYFFDSRGKRGNPTLLYRYNTCDARKSMVSITSNNIYIYTTTNAYYL